MATLARELGLTGATNTIDIQVETIFAKTLQNEVIYCRDYLRRGDLRHFPTGGADLVTMIVVTIDCLVFRDSFDMMTHDQTNIPEEVERVVKRRPADRESIFLFQFRFKLIKGEVTFTVVDGAQ